MDAIRSGTRQGVKQPCAGQLPYSLVAREFVESAEMRAALEASGAGVVASFVMAGGVLTGKYDAGGSGRADEDFETRPVRGRARAGTAPARARPGDRVQRRGARDRVRARQSAVASVLIGATSPEQLADDVAALEIGPAAVRRLLDE